MESFGAPFMPSVEIKKSQIYITNVNRIQNLLFKPNL